MHVSLAAALLSASLSSGSYVVDPAGSVVKFHLDHKMHAVDGRTSQIEGKAILADDGKVMTMIRIPAASFDTADGNRDSHMRQTLEVAKHPYIVYKGVTTLAVPVAHGKTVDAKLEGELEFHGVKQPFTIPAKITLGADGTATVKAKFPVNLEAHKIERPSLLFIKVAENVELDIELKLTGGK